MWSRHLVVRQLPLALAYFAAAGLAILLTRFDGGVALLWGASSILIAGLVRTPQRYWPYLLAACGATGFLATGIWGFGWAAAPYFVVVNLLEAIIGAWLLRRNRAASQTLDSLDWFVRFVVAVGFAAPLAGAVLAAFWMSATGNPVFPNFFSYFFGHGLGNLTFTPLAMLVTGRRAQRSTWAALWNRRHDAAILFPMFLVITLLVFSQHRLPLLFLPVLPIILISFRTGREGAALAIALLGLVGGGLTAVGMGPSQLAGGDVGFRLLFIQFYLAATVLTVLPVAADLQHRKFLNRQLRASEERFRLLADYSTDIIFKLEPHGRIKYVSPAVRHFGYSEEELVGRNCGMLIDPDHLADATAAHLRTLKGGTNRFEYLALAKDGSKHWCESHCRLIADRRGGGIIISIVRNIDERKRNESRLAEAALTDALTGLPNRRAFRNSAQLQLAQLAVGQGCCIALFDIDHFKRVNDRHGHDAGDDVLRTFARIAGRAVRDHDLLARLGGEEFAIILPDTSIEQALMVCERLRAEIARTPIPVGDEQVEITVSGGVARLDDSGIDVAMKRADRALYHAKDGGRDQLALAA
jgi:diguanylate cyclase (GGDEF)-like protein/PAS domain S-box-containing protein